MPKDKEVAFELYWAEKELTLISMLSLINTPGPSLRAMLKEAHYITWLAGGNEVLSGVNMELDKNNKVSQDEGT